MNAIAPRIATAKPPAIPANASLSDAPPCQTSVLPASAIDARELHLYNGGLSPLDPPRFA